MQIYFSKLLCTGMNMTTYMIGTSGWSFPEWLGGFYPSDLKNRQWLKFYSSNFNCVEINATFYRSFKDQTYLKWYNEVPENFRYILKAPRTVTHLQLLKNINEDLMRFWGSAQLLTNKLGLILLQLSPHQPYELNLLRQTLAQFDQPEKIAVEFRDAKWLTAETKSILEEYNSIFCNAESPKIPLIQWKATSNTNYFRLHGRKKWYAYKYSKNELKEIANIIKQLSNHKTDLTYVIFNNTMSGDAPWNALEMMELLL